jgi:glycosyltransferase involved in cell wall biosynthesis
MARSTSGDDQVNTTSSARRRILVATGDVLEPKMAGPAIRAWQIARALSADHDVELVSTNRCNLEHPDFRIRHVNRWTIVPAIQQSDVIIMQGHLMAAHPELMTTENVVIADIYDPYHLEVLEQTRHLPLEDRYVAVEASTGTMNQQLTRGDFFMCASPKQRDFWLGQLAAVGRINPATYDDGENLERLLTIVPFGVSDQPPLHTRPALKGVVPGIGPNDRVILWGGGVYSWFDPLTLLRAVHQLRDRIPDLRLYFLGLKHPNPHVGEMQMAVDTRALANELGLTGTHVFFNEDWVEYEDRANYLLESDVGVSTHLDHVETAFSFRTRILDYLWAGLPVVATNGDSLAETIEAAGAGFAVPPNDVDALAAALDRLLSDSEVHAKCRANSAALAEQFRWSRVLEPLLDFCADPRRAPDLLGPEAAGRFKESSLSPGTPGWRLRRIRRDVEILLGYVKRGDLDGLVRRTRRRLSA